MRIDHYVQIVVVHRGYVQIVGQTPRLLRLVNRFTQAIPSHVVPPEDGTRQAGTPLAKSDHLLEKAEHVAM